VWLQYENIFLTGGPVATDGFYPRKLGIEGDREGERIRFFAQGKPLLYCRGKTLHVLIRPFCAFVSLWHD
jgi:hypothetical protein